MRVIKQPDVSCLRSPRLTLNAGSSPLFKKEKEKPSGTATVGYFKKQMGREHGYGPDACDGAPHLTYNVRR